MFNYYTKCMKTLFVITFLLLTITSFGQRVYLDKNHNPLVSEDDSLQAVYYKLVEYTDGTKAYKETIYYVSGEKESEYQYIKVKEVSGKPIYKQVGISNAWYENGRLKTVIDRDENGYKSILTYWEDGVIKRNDKFNKGKLKEGICYNRSGEEIKHYDYEMMPQYQGGDAQLLQEIASNTHYPERSRDAGIQGKVIVKFIVNQDGTISSPGILVGVNPELDNEALRVVQTLKRFKLPAFIDGEPVPTNYMVPITFTIREIR
jgi:protein TonB